MDGLSDDEAFMTVQTPLETEVDSDDEIFANEDTPIGVSQTLDFKNSCSFWVSNPWGLQIKRQPLLEITRILLRLCESSFPHRPGRTTIPHAMCLVDVSRWRHNR